MKRWASALLFASVLAACGQSDTEPPPNLQEFVLDQAPADVGTRLDIGFDGRVTLLGARVKAPTKLTAGDKVRLKLFWRSDGRVGKNVRLSTHLIDGAGKRIAEIDYAGPLRKRVHRDQAFGPGRWTPGKIYVDEQTFRVPKTLKTEKLEVAVSLIDGNARLPIVRGQGDAQNRATVATLVVRPESAKKKPRREPKPPTSVGSAAGAEPAVSGTVVRSTQAPQGTKSPTGDVKATAPAATTNSAPKTSVPAPK